MQFIIKLNLKIDLFSVPPVSPNKHKILLKTLEQLASAYPKRKSMLKLLLLSCL